MEDQPNSNSASSDVLEELRELGRNLKSMLQTMWESEERKKLERELETGLSEAYQSLSQAAHDFAETPTGKQLQSELKEIKERIRSGELETQVRNEILAALRAANAGLRKAAQKPAASEASSPPDPES